MEQKIITLKQEKYQVGFPDYDVAGEFFADIIKKKGYVKKDADTFIELKNYQESDDKLHIMIIGNKLKASVIERRTAFNDLEYTLCAWD